MAKFSLSNKALEDLSEIWDYTYDVWSENQADKYYKLLIGFCIQIAKKPEIGRNYKETSQNVLGFKAGEHIIFYLIIDNGEIEIARILHAKMDLGAKMTEL
ncbi:type II toxin-antitoxin system RelE/ParE family toxin [Pedobacter alluvionis]|uniref:Toxin n=1 Tax=Pedobacter alluvionis TaxID=475253 RepID=A0A497XZI1_9SPHI|nr:type II toxin-antitoxin system RelE/ParE family toxin [Pedobacter alluvionis]RLJ74849.1 toxin ParE1/3/4 [Pedobacter alluvionis]TFB29978.1 type II toxin-antitoxin system RelE/ParE family toxin [Pedobacter alluvionis]